MRTGYSHLGFDFASDGDFVVRVANAQFVNLQTILEIDGEKLLQVYLPEEAGGPPRISARFFDRDNAEIAAIVKNQWRGSAEAFDIEARGNRIVARSGTRAIDLSVVLEPPNIFAVESMNLAFNDSRVAGSVADGFEVRTPDASLKVPSDPVLVRSAPFWLSISDGQIRLGSDSTVRFTRANGSVRYLPGYYQVEDADVEFMHSDGEVPPLPSTIQSDEPLLKVVSRKPGSGIAVHFNIPREPLPAREGTGPEIRLERDALPEQVVLRELMRLSGQFQAFYAAERGKIPWALYWAQDLSLKDSHPWQVRVRPTGERVICLRGVPARVGDAFNITRALRHLILDAEGFPSTISKGPAPFLSTALNDAIRAPVIDRGLTEYGFDLWCQYDVEAAVAMREMEQFPSAPTDRYYWLLWLFVYVGQRLAWEFRNAVRPRAGNDLRMFFDSRYPKLGNEAQQMLHLIKMVGYTTPQEQMGLLVAVIKGYGLWDIVGVR